MASLIDIYSSTAVGRDTAVRGDLAVNESHSLLAVVSALQLHASSSNQRVWPEKKLSTRRQRHAADMYSTHTEPNYKPMMHLDAVLAQHT